MAVVWWRKKNNDSRNDVGYDVGNDVGRIPVFEAAFVPPTTTTSAFTAVETPNDRTAVRFRPSVEGSSSALSYQQQVGHTHDIKVSPAIPVYTATKELERTLGGNEADF